MTFIKHLRTPLNLFLLFLLVVVVGAGFIRYESSPVSAYADPSITIDVTTSYVDHDYTCPLQDTLHIEGTYNTGETLGAYNYYVELWLGEMSYGTAFPRERIGVRELGSGNFGGAELSGSYSFTRYAGTNQIADHSWDEYVVIAKVTTIWSGSSIYEPDETYATIVQTDETFLHDDVPGVSADPETWVDVTVHELEHVDNDESRDALSFWVSHERADQMRFIVKVNGIEIRNERLGESYNECSDDLFIELESPGTLTHAESYDIEASLHKCGGVITCNTWQETPAASAEATAEGLTHEGGGGGEE